MNKKVLYSPPLLVILLLASLLSASAGIFVLLNTSSNVPQATAIIADHSIINMIRLDQIPESAIITAKDSLHIAYGHTSHGSQIITGMNGLPAFKESQGGTEGLYDWNEGGSGGALDIDDYFVSGDLGNPDRITWANRTRDYLNNPDNDDVNVVMWSWCGQVSSASEEDIDLYLALMTELEEDFPEVQFVYMTGHTDGSGLDGNLHIRNNQIRDYCTTHNKILYDFADIESYDPDGSYFGDKNVTDNCEYDSNGDGNPWNDGANWALEWQTAHPDDWYDCSSAHSQPLNANQKAYAAWWLWARLAGWDGTVTTTTVSSPPPTTTSPPPTNTSSPPPTTTSPPPTNTSSPPSTTVPPPPTTTSPPSSSEPTSADYSYSLSLGSILLLFTLSFISVFLVNIIFYRNKRKE